ncbi:MAG: M15 family metallopeptidase [Bacteroidales bacterium]|nr:M15 family metallopeptidase [Bacteroidales bacterium]
MKKTISILAILLILSACTNQGTTAQNLIDTSKIDTNIISEVVEIQPQIPEYAQKLIDVYPDIKLSYNDNKLVFPDGTAIIYDDGKEKSFEDMLDNSDIEDMFSMKYDTISTTPKYLSDCGRSRNEELFKKMYGNSAAEVQKNLVKIEWFNQQIPITKINGVDKHLKAVYEELKAKPEFKKYLLQASSFYWRKVRGANRQSAHSYGIAFDINVANSNYWLWSFPGKTETDSIKYVNRIPLEIVKIFEKHGFIWGGRWYHFDTMHFEYRPEFL